MNINLDEFKKICNTGDIILFSSDKWYSRIIEYFTSSKFSHIGIILKDPTYLNPKLKGLYLFESGAELNPSPEDNKKKIGVQITNFDDIIDYCKKNNKYGKIYYRKLNCIRDDNFINKIKEIHNVTYDKPYDIDLIDWIKAEFDIEIGNEQKINTFWCSALVAYSYSKLGFLDNNIPWTIISPTQFSYYEKNRELTYNNCTLEPEKQIIE